MLEQMKYEENDGLIPTDIEMISMSYFELNNGFRVEVHDKLFGEEIEQ